MKNSKIEIGTKIRVNDDEQFYTVEYANDERVFVKGLNHSYHISECEIVTPENENGVSLIK